MLERLRGALEEKGLLKHGMKSKIADATGYSKAQTGQILSGKEPLNERFLTAVCSAFHINQVWVRTGDGLPFLPEPSSSFITVPVYGRISCGFGVEPGGQEEIGVVVVPIKYDRPSIIMVVARGRSMEPTIREGGYVGIDTSERDVISGEMYAVCSQLEGAVIKRVVVKDDCLELVPDNLIFKVTEIREVPDYFIIGRVRLVVNEY